MNDVFKEILSILIPILKKSAHRNIEEGGRPYEVILSVAFPRMR
jgi:hypothetical protein